MQGVKRKSAPCLMLLAISILLTPNFMVLTASATADSDAVKLVEANVVWERTYGGAGDDRAFHMVAVEDGFIVVGSSKSLQQDVTVAWVLRLDMEGNMLWNKTFFEGEGSEFRSVTELDDGFLLVGNVFLPSGNIDGYVVKVGDDGSLRWNLTLGGEEVDKLFSAVETQDGFMLAGLTYSFGDDSEVWVVKIDGDGNEVWSETYGGTGEDAGRAVARIEDDYVVAGYTNSMGSGDYDFLLLEVDASGNMAWNKTYGGLESDKAYAIAETADGCVVAGDTRSQGEGESDAWMIKVDVKGELVWERTAGGGSFDMPTCIAVSSSEGFLVGGFTFSFGNGQRDFWLLKVDDEGNVPWSCTVGRSEYEEAYATLEAAENEYVMAGWTNSIGQGHYDYYVVKISVENDWTPAYNFVVSALILSVIVIVALVGVFLLIRRYVNQKISRQNVNEV